MSPSRRRHPRSGGATRIAALMAAMVVGALPGLRAEEACPAPQALVVQVGSSGIGGLTAVNLDSGLSTVLTGAFQNAQFTALDEQKQVAYVTDAAGGTLSRVDLATGTIEIVASGLDSPRGVALDAARTNAFVSEWGAGRVSRVDLATGDVHPLADGLPGPIGLALNAAETTAYVAAGELYRVDLSSGETALAAPMPGAGLGILGVAVDASETTAYVTVPNAGELLAVDLLDGTSRSVASGLGVPFGVALDAYELTAYVASPFDFSLVAVDLGSGAVTPVASGVPAVGPALNAAGTDVLVSGGSTLTSVTLSTGAARVVAAGLAGPRGMALDAAESNVYLTEYGRLRVYHRASRILSTVAEGFSGLEGVALDPGGSRAFVTEGSRLLKVDLSTGASAPVAAGLLSPSAVAVAPAGDRAWVLEEDDDLELGILASVDLASGSVSPVASLPPRPGGLALDSTGTAAFVTGQGSLWRVSLTSGAVETVASGLDAQAGKVAGVALDAAGTHAFVTESSTGGLASVDLSTGEVTRISAVLQQPVAVALTSAGASTDQPPRAVPRLQAAFECTSPAGAAVFLDGSASWDPDSTGTGGGDISSYEWYENFGTPGQVLLGRGATLETTLPLGSHEVTLVVTDRCGRSDLQSALTRVEDTTPPSLSLSASPDLIWPPNHRMVGVRVSGTVLEECGRASVELVSVTSSEPEDAPGPGDGATLQDVRGAAAGTPDFDFQVRAERQARGPGRTYTVVYRAVDAAGNTGTAATTLLVPHDLQGVVDPVALRVDAGASGTVVSWDPVPGAVSYDVVRGRISDLAEASGAIQLGAVSYLAAGTPLTDTRASEDPEIPAAGEAFFYLVEYNDGGPSGYGAASAAKPRRPASSPGGSGGGIRTVTR